MRGPERRLLPGRIAIEAEQGLVGHPPQPLELVFGERSTEWGDRFAEPGLGERDDVHIAFDGDDPADLARGGLRAIEIVERAALVE